MYVVRNYIYFCFFPSGWLQYFVVQRVHCYAAVPLRRARPMQGNIYARNLRFIMQYS